MVPIGDGHLFGLDHQSMGKAQDELPQFVAQFKLISYETGFNAITLTGAQHQNASRIVFAAQQHGNTDQPLVSDDSGLGTCSACRLIQPCNYGVCREIHIFERKTGVIDDLASWHGYMFKKRQQAGVAWEEQRCEILVLLGTLRWKHDELQYRSSIGKCSRYMSPITLVVLQQY